PSCEEEDVQYEEEILRNPFSVRCWLRYVEARQKGPRQGLNLVYERALRELPGRYGCPRPRGVTGTSPGGGGAGAVSPGPQGAARQVRLSPGGDRDVPAW
uniref:Pre-mRNA-splicing factor Syf1-like N-terminal HAT-repeats domain-containing protein n=1 Tax=Dromaius novaehollandiae TaxID=8790 RepID=A0A8C4KQ31_DRONO